MIKRFKNFIYESKFDSLALVIAHDLFSIVKSTAGTKPGKAIHKELTYSDPLEFSLNFIVKRVIQFNPRRSAHFKTLPWEVLNFEDNGFALDANAYIPNSSEYEDPELELILYISPDAEPLSYEVLNHKLVEYIRHEIEHLLQTGINRRAGHMIKTPNKVRSKAETSYKYFLLSDEIPAMVAGMHAAAVRKRIPIDQEFEIYLNPFLRSGLINDTEFNKVIKTWIQFAKQVYPEAKFSNKVY
jgi:hypothetical protein